MPRGFRGYGYLTQLVAAGHQSPPEEVWAGEMGCGPIQALRIAENMDRYEEKHDRLCPPGLIRAWARTQGLDPPTEMIQKLLEERKQWRGRRAHHEPAPPVSKFTVAISIVPSGRGTVVPDGGEFDPGEIVVFTATPTAGWEFDKWTGDYSGTDNPVTIELDDDMSVTARFKKVK